VIADNKKRPGGNFTVVMEFNGGRPIQTEIFRRTYELIVTIVVILGIVKIFTGGTSYTFNDRSLAS